MDNCRQVAWLGVVLLGWFFWKLCHTSGVFKPPGGVGASVPRPPGGRRGREVGSGSLTSVTNPCQAPANANNHCRNRFNSNEPRARSWGWFSLLSPPRDSPSRKRRGSGPGARRSPASSRKKGLQRTSPLHTARNFSLFFLSCCFLFSSARGTRGVLYTPNRRAMGR